MNEKLVVLQPDLRPPRLPRLRLIARRDCEYIYAAALPQSFAAPIRRQDSRMI